MATQEPSMGYKGKGRQTYPLNSKESALPLPILPMTIGTFYQETEY